MIEISYLFSDNANHLRLIFVRRYPDFGGRFLCTAGNCKIAASKNYISAKYRSKKCVNLLEMNFTLQIQHVMHQTISQKEKLTTNQLSNKKY